MYKVKSAQYCEMSETLVPAGEAASGICGDDGVAGAALARIEFPEQEYLYTFCPDKALCYGTAFPELVNAG